MMLGGGMHLSHCGPRESVSGVRRDEGRKLF